MDKQHLQNIDKVEIHNHNHVDTAEILSLLNVLKMQNKKILERLECNNEIMDSWLMRLGKAIGAIEKVSDQV